MFLKRTWVQFLEHTINCNSSFRRCNTGTRHAYKAHKYMSEKHSSNKSFSKIIYASNGKISKLIHEVPISFMIQKNKNKKKGHFYHSKKTKPLGINLFKIPRQMCLSVKYSVRMQTSQIHMSYTQMTACLNCLFFYNQV